ncbi:vegetative incompatibility protein 4 [Diaporthe amygdali]|uniref:vegetative incompatibility protein 4 n=1 Tax=Phomopsis amygdali TaxID=1214568 RepID=UPI0022FE0124|nr:vegetative incompatibility protein 4 [Diaporthe amygdali]KAJ0115033.1 vegetative incompatibility protein 4 [Diaporthe amygdali]
MPHFESAPKYSENDPAQTDKQKTGPVPPYEEFQVKALQRRDTDLIFFDEAVINAIGDDETIVNAERYGNSSWSATGKLTTKRADGTLHEYFLKIIKGDLAGPRVLGEFACMKELEGAVPSLVPQAKAAGKCLDSEGAFFLCDYLEIDHRPANPEQLGKKIAELHRASESPTGKFGFHLTPYDGKLPLAAEWDSNWTSFFTKLLSGVYQLDKKVNGSWPELDDAMELTLKTVIPRLLNRLTEDGRTVKPCLIHGDLHEQNIGTELRTGNIYIFDSCAYYAHHEMAMGMWRVDHHHMKAREYRREYFKNYPPDEPQEEADDRNRLYAVKEEIMYSAHVPGTKARSQALEDLKFLIEKYVDYEDSDEEEDDEDSDAASSTDEKQLLVPYSL